jgi:hypothetical protein
VTWLLIGLYVPEPPPVAKTFDLVESAVRRPSVMNDRIPDLVYLHVQSPLWAFDDIIFATTHRLVRHTNFV